MLRTVGMAGSVAFITVTTYSCDVTLHLSLCNCDAKYIKQLILLAEVTDDRMCKSSLKHSFIQQSRFIEGSASLPSFVVQCSGRNVRQR
jgi:hypothetical protein